MELFNYEIFFCYVMRVWRGNYRGTWYLYGHSYSNLPDKEDGFSFDIGVDYHDFYPLSYEILKYSNTSFNRSLIAKCTIKITRRQTLYFQS